MTCNIMEKTEQQYYLVASLICTPKYARKLQICLKIVLYSSVEQNYKHIYFSWLENHYY